MKRRDFFRNTAFTALGASVLSPFQSIAGNRPMKNPSVRKAKNIIFMVSDGMSTGTLNMANLLLQRKEGRQSNWLSLYERNEAVRALMDTASASSLVTDSAAASSSWGGGVRVPNGSLNVNADGSFNKPILQKFKAAGKSVGCVTSVPITHATPAGFCVNSNKRSDQPGIALQYLDLRFDVMMGGGLEFFSADKREDKQDLFAKYRQAGFMVFQNRDEMNTLSDKEDRPILGVFYADGLPYALDRANDPTLASTTPSLAEMTKAAIKKLKNNKNGFVLQIEGGKVDWAAHANDAGALIYDQLAFDEAIGEAMAFALADKETLVVLTTDHGNANPGLFYGEQANRNFDRIQSFKHTNDWILNGTDKSYTPSRLIERIEFAQGYSITIDEAKELLSHYETLDGDGLYNPRKLPFRKLAQIQEKHLSVGWGSMDHSADYVELAMYGPGSEQLKPFVKNIELHNFMLQTTGIFV
ncbi:MULTISPECIES: alkaline phosphatase [Olivibacter]|uniref:Alkaline phosphatase n=1 Tax=Olivibacter jilunii TaxID=985016 RepID=A0ABW6AW52_9SPHI|nr:alkaline phosphatase [Olivibacter sp. 47]MCL4637449.1 alkaline phosphatase [Olivibacter sp. UJ_SKK_5.1]MDM8174687.1 alkaline phosphatase [Olivibacter sp. 47]MDX3913558.1 alkaline phosphatase [Pseudosphingobacterium sp.]